MRPSGAGSFQEEGGSGEATDLAMSGNFESSVGTLQAWQPACVHSAAVVAAGTSAATTAKPRLHGSSANRHSERDQARRLADINDHRFISSTSASAIGMCSSA